MHARCHCQLATEVIIMNQTGEATYHPNTHRPYHAKGVSSIDLAASNLNPTTQMPYWMDNEMSWSMILIQGLRGFQSGMRLGLPTVIDQFLGYFDRRAPKDEKLMEIQRSWLKGWRERAWQRGIGGNFEGRLGLVVFKEPWRRQTAMEQPGDDEC